MRIDIRDNFVEVKRALANKQKQVAFATAVALTRTAKRIEEDLRKEMVRVFDRPTRYTLSSLRTKTATKQNLTAQVYFKDAIKGGSPGQYLQPQIEGGSRLPKRFEILLRQSGALAPGYFVVPGSGARLNQYGNMSPGQITQILSGVQASFDVYQRSSKASRKRNPKPFQYFVSRGGHLAYGVWQRIGVRVVPVMIFVKDVNYKKRFRFYEGGNKAPAYFAQEFPVAYANALRTAR